MNEVASRRLFLRWAAGAVGGLGTAAWGLRCEPAPRGQVAQPVPTAPSSPLSVEEKARLKSELQRELERKVYSVDERLFRQISRAKDPARLAGHERSHVPKIIAPRRVRPFEAFAVRVEVGVEEIHEMSPFHYVDWIDLSADGVEISQVTLTPFYSLPILTFNLVLEHSATLLAREHCNLHGVWESEPCRVEVAA